MKTQRLSSSIGLVACALAFCLLGEVRGQAAAPAAPSSDILRIRKVTELGRDMFQRAPSMGNRSPKQKDWGVLDVTFDSAPEWIDEMTVTFTVMLQNKKAKQGEPAFSLLTLTSEYRDIAQGRDRKAGVVILPVAMERHGQPIGIGVQFFRDGELIAESGVGAESLSSKEKWWGNKQITDHPTVRKRDGYLIERSKSPFALVDIDSYEASR